MFKKASLAAHTEIELRRHARKGLLSFGIPFLDRALVGIMPHDLILVGAPSGIGKTQLCVNIALANIANAKRVHYFALEAEEHEIERRLKFQIVAHSFYSDPNRPRLSEPFTFDRWMLGDFIDELSDYERRAADFFERAYGNLHLYYKADTFGIKDLIEQTILIAPETDLIIVDHAHYFDFEDDNENRAMRDLAKTARTLALEEGKPILLVSHLRKRDRANTELCAGLDEFHGSSDLFKIATKVITIAPGEQTQSGAYETFFRTPKNRMNGSVTRYIGRHTFSPKDNSYSQDFKLGSANQSRADGFTELDRDLYPEWARGSWNVGGSSDPVAQAKSRPDANQGRPTTVQASPRPSQGKYTRAWGVPRTDDAG